MGISIILYSRRIVLCANHMAYLKGSIWSDLHSCACIYPFPSAGSYIFSFFLFFIFFLHLRRFLG